MAVPFLDIVGQYRECREEIDRVLLEVAGSGKYILGNHVTELEKQLAAYCDVPHAVGCASGTDALILALRAYDIGPGDEVITTAYSFFSTASCIALVGATPVFVDIDPRTFNIDTAMVMQKLTTRTKAVIPVHLYGQPAEMEPLVAMGEDWGVKIIEDACQSIGAAYKRKRVCSLGDIGCVSFYPTKNLSGMGDGGMLFTHSEATAGMLRLLREHGAKPKYYHRWLGYNSRLDEIQAAVIAVKAQKIEEWTEARRRNAQRYNELFMGSDIVTPVELPYVRHVYNQYVVRAPKRNALMNSLREKEIGCAVYYPCPLHLQECFASLGYRKGDFPEAEKAAAETLALPVFPGMTEEQVREVAGAVLSFYR